LPNAISDADLTVVKQFLTSTGLKHLRCRKRANTIVIESGPNDDPFPRIRLRKVAARLWSTDAATHTGRWEVMPPRGPLNDNLQAFAGTFPWLLAE
jgi:hypothetical protein